jgi:hypothetical protein
MVNLRIIVFSLIRKSKKIVVFRGTTSKIIFHEQEITGIYGIIYRKSGLSSID